MLDAAEASGEEALLEVREALPSELAVLADLAAESPVEEEQDPGG